MTGIDTTIENSEPADGGPYQTESGWTTNSLALSNGCIGRRSGLEVYSDEAGRQVKVTAGRFMIRGHIYTLASDKTCTVDANLSGHDPIDTTILRLDTLGRQAYMTVLPGPTPTVSPFTPTPPTLTQIPGGIWEEAIADFPVPAAFTTIDADSIIDRRRVSGSGLDWIDYDPDVYNTSGATVDLHDHPQNRARFRLDGNTCRVSWKHLISVRSSVLSYGAGLPIPARFPNVVGQPSYRTSRSASGTRSLTRSAAEALPTTSGY